MEKSNGIKTCKSAKSLHHEVTGQFYNPREFYVSGYGDRASVMVRDEVRLEKWPEPNDEGLCEVML